MVLVGVLVGACSQLIGERGLWDGGVVGLCLMCFCVSQLVVRGHLAVVNAVVIPRAYHVT